MANQSDRHAIQAPAPSHGKLANLDPNGVLVRLADGESVRDVAKSLGVSQTALYAYLLRERPSEWLAISTGRALAKVEQAETDLDAALDQVAVSRAREAHRMATWTLERAARQIYGDVKSPDANVKVVVVLDRLCGGEAEEG